MIEVRDTSKPNSIASADWGELNATSERDSTPPPTSDRDSYAEDPISAACIGPMPGADHNSGSLQMGGGR